LGLDDLQGAVRPPTHPLLHHLPRQDADPCAAAGHAVAFGHRRGPVRQALRSFSAPWEHPMARLTTAVRKRFLRFRREILVVAYAITNPATPLHLKLAGAAVILYLASPVDLIPIVVPVFGLLDDLIIVPWGLSQVVKRLPAEARSEAEARAARLIQRYVARPLRFLLYLVLLLILLWTALLWLLWWLIFS